MIAELASIPLGFCQCGCGGRTPLASKTVNARGVIKGQPLRFIQGHNYNRRGNEVDRFLDKVRKTDGCWIWQGASHEKGYGCFFFRGRKRSAHVVSYTLFVGEVPDGLMVCHECDNPPCVRPDHLFVGTNQDNILDAFSKGRGCSQVHPDKYFGVRSVNAKLTDCAVVEARVCARLGESSRSIAERLSVTDRTLRRIIDEERYAVIRCPKANAFRAVASHVAECDRCRRYWRIPLGNSPCEAYSTLEDAYWAAACLCAS
jgi:hypothetical protein